MTKVSFLSSDRKIRRVQVDSIEEQREHVCKKTNGLHNWSRSGAVLHVQGFFASDAGTW